MVHHKVTIIGSGPAAHTAAIYLARAEIKPTLYEGMLANGIAAGGQLTTTTDIENFPGFPNGIGGSELMEKMKEQSQRFGTEIITETISKLISLKDLLNYGLNGMKMQNQSLLMPLSLLLVPLPRECIYQGKTLIGNKVFLPVLFVTALFQFSETTH